MNALAERYRELAFSVSKDALLEQIANKTLHARIHRQYAVITRRAAMAEEVNPDTPRYPSRLCGGTYCGAKGPLRFDDEGTLL